MKLKRFMIAMLAIAVTVTSCKKDGEGDIIPTPSSITGLFINEAYSSNPDWVELYNSNDTEIDLSGFILQDDKGAAEEYKIPTGTKIAAKSYLVLEAFSFGLSSSSGDQVKLLDSNNALVDEISVPVMEAGKSYGRATDGGATWKMWDAPTKGKDNTFTGVEEPTSGVKLLINELVSSPSAGNDWIELYNNSDQEIDMSGMVIYDGGGVAKGYTFTRGTKIAARILMVIETFSGNTAGPTFGLSSGGDNVVLIDKAGVEIDKATIPALAADQAYARMGNGGTQWQIVDAPSKGTNNPTTAVVSLNGKIVINEVYTDGSANTGITDWDAAVDFIELYNNTNSPLDISGWEIYDDTADESKKYVVPAGTIVPSKGYLVYDVFKDNPNGPIFGLGVSGDWVFVYNKAGRQEVDLVDKMEIPGLIKDVTPQQRDKGYTYGRFTDGSTSLSFFKKASKGASNNGKEIVVFE